MSRNSDRLIFASTRGRTVNHTEGESPDVPFMRHITPNLVQGVYRFPEGQGPKERSFPYSYPPPLKRSPLPLEVDVQTDRDHMTVVIELLILNVLILGFHFFQPNVSIGAVD